MYGKEEEDFASGFLKAVTEMDVSDAVKRLQYSPAEPDQDRDECDKAFWIKMTLDNVIGETLNFRIPPDPVAFTDVNAAYISVTFRVVKADGDPLDEYDDVFLSPGNLQSLFDTCQIFLNGKALEPSTAYSFGATLTSYLGLSKEAREDVWAQLAGMTLPNYTSSKITPAEANMFLDRMDTVALSREVTLTGRLMSDFTQSCAQLLPPGMMLEVRLRRNPDAFSLCSVSEDQNTRYKIEISSSALFLRRVHLSRPLMERTLTAIEDGGYLAYTRMDCLVNQVPAGGTSFRVGNMYGGRELPHTLYLILANEKAFNGAQDYLGNYFESGNLKSVQVYQNGQPVTADPIVTKYKYYGNGYSLDIQSSDATEPFLSMTQAMNGIADSFISAGLDYKNFLLGCIVTCVQLNSCGGRRVMPGYVDVELEFQHSDHNEPMLLLCFGEYGKMIRFDGNRHLVPY